jgi:hypothetical protein
MVLKLSVLIVKGTDDFRYLAADGKIILKRIYAGKVWAEFLLTQDRNQCQVLVNTGRYFRDPGSDLQLQGPWRNQNAEAPHGNNKFCYDNSFFFYCSYFL